ncbi:signal peptidase II [Candidatus Magnetomonas plexicatena]|uniref:signal peptidase II n=1 Tax=Candidatus Magnetomonas plexicatena TaxID=2552947 RepID=UPI0011051FEC|nr:signal peptidase II [Nitrospirales bacterium LBB_01]
MMRLTKYFTVSLAVFVLDQVTKYLITFKLTLYDVVPITSFFNIVSARNLGSAFSTFQSLGNPIFITITLIALVVIIVLMIKSDKREALSYSLLLGGAAGNLFDRIVRGSVVDFLDFHIGSYHWPAFNIADSALTIGIFYIILNQFVLVKRH